jgi:hypothetical protein
MKCTQYGLYGPAAFKNARVRPRSGKPRSGKPWSGAEALTVSVLTLPVNLMRAMLVGGIWTPQLQF